MSLAVVGATSLGGALVHARAGRVDLRAALVFGLGGGFLVVPALTLLAGLPIHTAVGTSLLVIALNAAAGLAGHLRQGEIPLGITAAFTATSLLGAFAGGRLSGRVEPARLRRAFAVFVILIGLALFAANVRPA